VRAGLGHRANHTSHLFVSGIDVGLAEQVHTDPLPRSSIPGMGPVGPDLSDWRALGQLSQVGATGDPLR